ncbi:SDR family NAD(P)-dependent oxidoreductase [Amycolatopsis pithecellobii]|uniref:SDR family oxidoreductase n=1 Tax=Amycolatopsis pithecellobii TaxID=664692 RepID=A0A6N7YKX1_9PSEU|nr:SDR family oxidoreductase [Amycolatopsis pithecellobii]MTD52538.1 SDR family oxidoreductase [Amycolatopsis pithecellobii]
MNRTPAWYGLEGKVAFVTGGASGIGECCARLLAERGAKVVIADINLDRAKEVAHSVGGHAVQLDIVDEENVSAQIAAVEDSVGLLEIAVLSAGIAQFPSRTEDYSLSDWDRIVDVDLRGSYVSAVAVGNRMADRGSGSIVLIGSIAGMRSVPLHAYGPAKAAVIAMAANLAAEWGRSGVRVNCVSPGYTLTPLLQGMIDRGERDPSVMEDSSALGRLVHGEEVARAVAFLSSSEAGAITGINLPVDAGWLTATSWHTYGGLPVAR